jgi:hypothetical protein
VLTLESLLQFLPSASILFFFLFTSTSSSTVLECSSLILVFFRSQHLCRLLYSVIFQVGYSGSRGYSSLATFVADLRLVVQNCCAYNAPGSEVFLLALALEKQAKKVLNEATGSTSQRTTKRPRR